MRPNILLLTCHDLGRHLGCYGVPTVVTPHFDRLAATGVRLASAFTTAPSCSPARAALATGRYPHANGVMGLTHPPFGWDLNPGERHMARILGDAGYATHLFGFQHVSPYWDRLGFGHIHTDVDWGLANRVAAKIGAFFRDWDRERPFYLEANLEEPHRPYDQDNCGPDTSRGVTVPGYLPEGEASRTEMAALQGAITQADRAIGAILGSLDDAGLAENTCVVFSADHGIAMPGAKCTLYDAGLEIAMLLRWQGGGVSGGRVVEGLVSNVDLLPTLLELAAIPTPSNLQGMSFAAALHGASETARSEVFAEKTQHSYYDPMRAIRTARYKYIRNFEPCFRVEVPADIAVGPIYRQHVERYVASQHPPEELYDLQADPLEEHSLIGDPAYEEARGELSETLLAWMEETGDPLLDGPIPLPGFQPPEAAATMPGGG